MILLIDNYDSFSYNLYQLIGTIEPDIKVIRNDEMTVEEVNREPIHFRQCSACVHWRLTRFISFSRREDLCMCIHH